MIRQANQSAVVVDGAAVPFAQALAITGPNGQQSLDIYTPQGFSLLSSLWTRSAWQQKTSWKITWLGFPIVQMPEDLVIMQELIFRLRPDIILETGTAHGGSAIFYSSMCELIGHGNVISVDVCIQSHVALQIGSHPMGKRITLIEGNSTSDETLCKIRRLIPTGAKVLVCLDSDHSKWHVLSELRAYADFVFADSYIVVFDGLIRELSDAPNGKPEWLHDNPAEAIETFLSERTDYVVDDYCTRLGATSCPSGFLKKVSLTGSLVGDQSLRGTQLGFDPMESAEKRIKQLDRNMQQLYDYINHLEKEKQSYEKRCQCALKSNRWTRFFSDMAKAWRTTLIGG